MLSHLRALRYYGDVLTLLHRRTPGSGDQITGQAGPHLPGIFVDAGLLYIGDIHAAQGDGELSGVASRFRLKSQ